jgi:8-oxo-dGTP diphosphatase
MSGDDAHVTSDASPARNFRCKVLKPPRWIDGITPENRIVTHPPIDVVAAVIRREDARILITQRLPDDTLGGYWEFPGGKVDPGEELRAALARELREELGLETQIGAEIHHIIHAYPDRDVRLFFYEARIVSGEPQKIEVADLRWVTLDEIGEYQFPEADRPLLEQLRREGQPPA